jgi:DNA mismatch endonuclease (patch repair protein)
MDTLSPADRSRVMAQVRSKDTKPEMAARRLTHALGYRYRLHGGKLPGKPDLVFAGRKKVIFVHGCYWHGHQGCPNYRVPKSGRDYWVAKLEGNIARDRAHQEKLREMGWESLVIWECELKKEPEKVAEKIQAFLGPARANSAKKKTPASEEASTRPPS